MIDRPARSDLATQLLRLVTGDMTNDEFDDNYGERRIDSEDAAVAEIATFGWGLYSDLTRYRLKGRHALPDELRRTADRAVLFLQTDLDYEWPRNVKGVVPFFSLWGPGCYLGMGMILLFVGAFTQRWEAILLVLFGLLSIAPTVYWLSTHPHRALELKRFKESGDLEVWPFLRRADFEKARRAADVEAHGEVG
jgi:hypothetical protein